MRPAAIVLFLAAMLPAVRASGRDPDSTARADTTAPARPATGILEIGSPVPGVNVYSDSQHLGTTPLAPACLDEGIHILRYVPPDADRWPSACVIETLTIKPGDHIVRTLDFPPVYHITTEPYGATVRRNGLDIGETPLDLRLSSTKELITVARDGYEAAAVPLTGEERHVHVFLHSKGGEPPDARSVYLSGEQSKSSLPIYITTGATVLTGAAAAFFKIKADNYYDDYKKTGNEGSLAQVRSLDLASGVSLAASELSLLTLAYFLLSR